jgi:ubiquitin carboxyl-terminal hydrolase 34
LPEVIRRLTTLLNTFNPPEMRKLTLNVLQVGKHLLNSENPNKLHIDPHPLPTAFDGSTRHFLSPSQHEELWQSSMKNILRPPRPMTQMNIPRTQAFTNVKGVDKEFDMAVERFYKPYHEFLDIFFRAAVTSNIFNENLNFFPINKNKKHAEVR